MTDDIKTSGWALFREKVVVETWSQFFRILFWVYLVIALAFGFFVPAPVRLAYLAPRACFLLLLYLVSRGRPGAVRLRLLFLLTALVAGAGNVHFISLGGHNMLVELMLAGILAVGLLELDYAWAGAMVLGIVAIGLFCMARVGTPLTPLVMVVPLLVGVTAARLRHDRLATHFGLLEKSRSLQRRLEIALNTVQACNQVLDQRVQERSLQLQQASLSLEEAHEKLRHSLQEQLELQRQWQQAERLETLGRFARGLHHEFSNELTVIQGALHFARQDAVDSEEQDILAGMEEAVARAVGISHRFLMTSGGMASRERPLELNRLISKKLKLLRPRLAPIEVGWVEAGEPVWVQGDAIQLEQILMNLVVNAAHFSPSGESVMVALESQGGKALLSVSDRGCGVPPELQSRIFEPFFTSKSVGQGFGLGLAIVAQLAQRHGGRCWLEPRLDQGSTFWVELPMVVPAETIGDADSGEHAEAAPSGWPATPPRMERTVPELKSAQTSGPAVLLVEDERPLRELLARYLRSQGHRVQTAATAEEALQAAGDFQVLVSDVMLPGMNGVRLAEKLLQDRPELRVVFITGYVGETVALPGPDENWALLLKPFDLPGLEQAIVRVCGGLAEGLPGLGTESAGQAG